MTSFLLSVAPTSVLIQSSCSGDSLASGMTRWPRASPVSLCKLKQQKLLDGETTCRFVLRRRHSHTLWFLADVVGLFSNNVVSFSRNVVLRDPLFSANLVPKRGCYRFEPIMFSVRYSYGRMKAKSESGSQLSAIKRNSDCTSATLRVSR